MLPRDVRVPPADRRRGERGAAAIARDSVLRPCRRVLNADVPASSSALAPARRCVGVAADSVERASPRPAGGSAVARRATREDGGTIDGCGR